MKLKILLIFCAFSTILNAQNSVQKENVNKLLLDYERQYHSMGNFKVVKLSQNDEKKTLELTLNANFAQIPFRAEIIEEFKLKIANLIGKDGKKYEIKIFANNHKIEDFIPNFFRKKREIDDERLSKTNRAGNHFVINHSLPFEIERGLNGRNIALWNSHGWYYEQKLSRWEWQRARLLRTVEDKFTTQIVLNFLLPMLENAGANVFLPRERDCQTNEIIVDNDTSQNFSIYSESGNLKNFTKEKPVGFAVKKEVLVENENPFTYGTCRIIKTDDKNTTSVSYIPNITEGGFYAVSVTSQICEKNVENAYYQVFHTGGVSEFTVNQTMGGGTWIYLGTFYFDRGINPDFGKVVLTNKGKKNGFVVADAVRFGGGMGNIARSSADFPPEISGQPRYLEGARYWLQWAGMPYEIYSHSAGESDYKDDYASRGKWATFLNNGSVNVPKECGLKIPLDLSLAFHSDAGLSDTITGTLTIYAEKSDNKTEFPNEQSRLASRDFADIVQNAVVEDIRRVYEPDWTNRGILNKSYAECSFSNVPSMILEIMSHQNLQDMQYGLSPEFQFFISRAVYKGVLKFLAFQNGDKYVVQPLPVRNFSAILLGDSVRLSWQPTKDSLEKTAISSGFIVYTRENGKGFDNGFFTKDTTITLCIEPDQTFSYKIAAVNSGGQSFPSEILSVCKKTNAKDVVLIVNGFERIAAPENFRNGEMAGFGNFLDCGVPYLRDFSFVGNQYEFDLKKAWKDDDNAGFGSSYGDFDGKIIAGNSFDYPCLYGLSVANAGYSFCSTSVKAVENNDLDLKDFKTAILILGKQKTTFLGNKKPDFQTFSDTLQKKLADYLENGNSLFVSGAFVGTDLWNFGDESGQNFAKNYLKFFFRSNHCSRKGEAKTVFPFYFSNNKTIEFYTLPNEFSYCADSSDGIEPVDNKAFTALRYSENNISAAVASKDKYKTFVCGFPFETIKTKEQRDTFMTLILNFLK
ncbi:MAG: N-acetylmuramoyl-L-alanine amidase [Prevotellaceae bacterium]|jgi:hypothetical protein|nr:N-acetylmuramoyl-L-alanine amidase [Prevotellaceae bacterium]